MPAVNTNFFVPPPVAPPVFSPIRPAGGRVVLDASVASSIRFGGSPAADGTAVDAWQDQSGNGADATQAAAINRPFYDTIGLGGKPAIVTGGPGIPLFSTPTWLNFTALVFQVPYVMVCLFRADSNQRGASNSQSMTIAEVSTNITAADGVILTSSNGWGARTRRAGNTENADTASPSFWAGNNQTQYVIVENDGLVTKITVNGVLQSVSNSGTAPGAGAITTSGTLGVGHTASNPLTGSIGFFGIWDSLSLTQRGQLDAYLRLNWNLTNLNETVKYQVFQIGDSIAGGANLQGNVAFHLNTPWAYAGAAGIALGGRFGLPFNISVSGSRLVGGGNLPDITTQGTMIDPYYLAGVVNIVNIEGGINSLGTDTAANILSQYLAIVSARVSALNSVPVGSHPHQVNCATITFAHGFSPANETDRQTINAGIRAALPGMGTANVRVNLVDAGADAMLGSAAGNIPTNTNFFESDGLHPAKSGQYRFAGILMQQMLAAGL